MPIFTGCRRPEFSHRITEASEKPVSLATWLLLSKNGWICSEGPGRSGVTFSFCCVGHVTILRLGAEWS